MLVKERMTKNPITVQVTTSIADLSNLMKENKLKKVPVVDGDKLVGIVTDKDVDRVSPSGATLLSVFEISALLAKTTVKDAMTTEVITCSPDTYIEDAAILMRQNKINALVITENDRVVGIITESDMLSSLIAMLGGNTEGNQYIIETEDVPGVLNRVGGITHDMGINMNNFVFTQRTADGKAELLIKTSKDGRLNEVADAFRLAGFTVKQASVK